MMKKMLTVALFAIGVATAADAQKQLPVYLDDSKPIEQRVEDALSRMTLSEKIAVIHAQSKFSSPGVKRLGLPDFWTDDGPHGVRPDVLWDEWEQAGQSNDSCVAFPALTCLASTWNPQMSKIYGVALGEEAVYRGKDMMLGPGVNIYRTPLNGRNFEYMGEDPYLASRMVVPYIQGLQSTGTSACVKHYALNNDEEYRHQVNVIVSDRALHEIYLPAFKAAVLEAGTWGIMGAYNYYKGQHNCHNEIMLNKILKGDWGYDGVVVSDWGGAHDMDEAVKNGLDMEFGTWTDGLTMGATNAYDNYYLSKNYLKAIAEGKYTDKELNDKVRRVLRLFFRTTMNRNRAQGFLCSESHYETALEVAHEGIVLLQNKNNLLPMNLTQGKKVLVVGENAIKMMTVGGGSSSLKVQKEVLPLEGIEAACEAVGATCDYARGYVGDINQSYNGVVVGRDLRDDRSKEELISEAVEKAKGVDYVIYVGGLNKSDFQDCEGHDRKTMDMPYAQNELMEALLKVNKNIVFVCISGNAISLPWKNKVPAIVQSWFLGSQSGNGIADVLTGKVNPSGKMPFTWYAKLEDCGAHATGSYPGTWRENKEIIDEEYKEDIFVGYRWTEKNKIKPLFPFGYGLSYTTFKLGKATADKTELTANDSISFTVSVTNTGKRAGSEVVQLYVSDLKSSLVRPLKELKGFKKVALEPGETRDVTITIGKDALSYYDDKAAAWVAEPGDFEALVGNASDNITSKVKFTLK